MQYDEVNQIINKLKTQGKMNFAPNATKAQIEKFEFLNKVILPVAYKRWLLSSDGGECFLPAGIQLYGVAHRPLIDVKDVDRPNDNYIVIGALASGDPIICEKTSDRVSIYNHEAGTIESDETFVDFMDFMNNLARTLGIED